jgi:predicted esterase
MRIGQAGRARQLSLVEDSPLRKADPRTKLFISIAISLVVMMSLDRLVIFIGIYAIFLTWARLLVPALQQIWRLKWLLLLLFAVDWWLISLDHAVIICARLVLLTGVFALFFSTTTTRELGLALEKLRPYSMQEGALDLGRAVRYVRKHAEDYGIENKDIAVIGFSAGGILWGKLLLNFDGTVNGTSIDPNYVPDELDKISADASAAGMIYSFYGRLSVASTDVEKFKNSDLPPAFFAYGTRDPFVREFEKCIEALRQAGVPVEDHVLQGWPHGFGVGDGQWIQDFDQWVTKIFENN